MIKGKDEIASTRILPDVSPEANKDELKGYEGQKQGQRIATTAAAPIPISVSISSPITSNGNNSMVPVINKLSIKQKYVQICKSKYFLVSKRVMGHEDMQNISISKQRLEIESGAFVGAGATREHLQRRIQTQIPARVSNRKRKLNLGGKEEEEEGEETLKEGNKQSSRQPFVEDEPFGAGSIITADELCLYHPTVDACWKKLYVEYGMATRPLRAFNSCG